MILVTTLSQMAYLFALIAIGYILSRFNFVPKGTESILSQLENRVFIPCLIIGTFMTNFTVEKLSGAGALLLGSAVVLIVVIPLSILCARICAKDNYMRNIYTYGFAFSNFAFMGNAIVKALFPEYFLSYLIFCTVLWIAIYAWGAPSLLMNVDKRFFGIRAKLRTFVNPMFIGMAIGIVVGLTKLRLPSFINEAVTSLGNCMSPIAMVLTGMTISRFKLGEILKFKSIYVFTVLRLIVFPMAFIGVVALIPSLSKDFVICTVCTLAMPIGLNTIVVPSAYGKDTKMAAGIAIVSHLCSCLTIPLIFTLVCKILGI